MYYAMFLLISVVTLFYFVKMKGRVDITSLAYYSCLFFFLPGFLGSTVLQIGWSIIYEDEIHEMTYCILMLTMLSCLMVSWISEKMRKRSDSRQTENEEFHTIVLRVSLSIGIVSFFLLLEKTQFQILTEPNKRVIFGAEGIEKSLHSAFRYSFAFAVLLSYLLRKRYSLIVSSVFMLIDIYMGFRSVAAITIIGLGLLFFREKKFSLAKYRKEIVALLLICAFMHGYKDIYQLVKSGKHSEIVDRVKRVGYVEHVIHRLPGFVQVSIINECVYQDFRVPAGHFYHLIELLLPVSITGEEIVTFNDRFQWALFPFKGKGGLAANPYAEFYSWNGLSGVMLFLVFNSLYLLLLNTVYRSNVKSTALAGITFVSSFHVFYINRCSVFQIMVIERRIIMLLAVIYLIALLYYACASIDFRARVSARTSVERITV